MEVGGIFRSKQLGLTLIELMIALAISGAIIGGIMSVFVNTKTTQRTVDAVSEIQQSGDFALQYLKRDLRMVGYQGCISNDDDAVNVITDSLTALQFNQRKFLGYEVSSATWENGTPFNDKFTAKLGTDAFSIGRITDLANALTGAEAQSIDLIVESNPTLRVVKDDLVLISDCNSADLFTILNTVTPSEGTATLTHSVGNAADSRLSKVYKNSDAVISTYKNTVYFVADTGRDNSAGEDVYALYLAQAPDFEREELIEGVENMQVLYGERMPTGNMRYVPANQLPAIDWNNVTSVKLALLLASHSGVRLTTDGSTYQMLTTQIKPPSASAEPRHSGGKRLKKIFSTTIKLRNRAF